MLKWVLPIAALVVIGFFVSKPIIGWIVNSDKPEIKDPVTSSQGDTVPGDDVPGDTPADDPVDDPVTDPVPEVKARKYYFVSQQNLITSADIAAAVQTVKNAGATYVVVPLKITGGTVTFKTNVKNAPVWSGAFDVKAVVDAFAAEDISVAGMVSAYQDNQYIANNRDAAANYVGTTSLWLDDSLANGGKAWLAPGKAPANDYIIALCSEAIDAGVSEIILSDATLPIAYMMDKANFGFGGASNQEGLQKGINTIGDAVKSKGASFGVYMSSRYYLLGANQANVDYRAIKADTYYADAAPENVANNVSIGSFVKTAGSTDQQVFDAVTAYLTDKVENLVVVSGGSVTTASEITFVR
ncbi:MAG: hypothetical protein IIX77_00110 [Oscillospiraceae bacterium]|nr:hypothetical protein [Oscillospiraceae bacterium]